MGETMQLTSLLDVILASRQGDISVKSRAMYAATVSEGSTLEELEEYHKDLGVQCGFYNDDMRGILLHFGNGTLLHLLEGPAPAVDSFLEALRVDGKKPMLHESIRMLLSTEDIDSYGFPNWACKDINLPRPDGDLDKKDPIAPHIYKTYSNLLEIGKQLLGKGGGELEEALENLRNNFHEKLPGNELVGSFIKSVHTTPLDSFAKIFSSEVQVLETSEQCWPQAPPLQY